MDNHLKKTKPKLLIDWANPESSKYACEKWHYSKCIPIGKMVRIGAWEDSKFIGVILFSPGACPDLGKPYGIGKYEVCELVRIALDHHVTPVSRILSLSLKFLRTHSPGIKLVVSFADPLQGHHGGIYQATNWIYNGCSSPTTQYWFRGKWTHPKTFRSEWSDLHHINLSILKKRTVPGKYRYLMVLDESLKDKIIKMKLPYPKRATSKDNVASGFQSEEGGAIPTVALQTQELANG